MKKLEYHPPLVKAVTFRVEVGSLNSIHGMGTELFNHPNARGTEMFNHPNARGMDSYSDRQGSGNESFFGDIF